MADNNNSSWGIAIIIVILILLISSCGEDEPSNLETGWDKWSHGDYDSMSDGEKDAVQDFLNWSNDN